MDYDYGFDERRAELRELAFIDESADYEVDQASICVDEKGTFYLLTASGCSCWSGEYEEEQYRLVSPNGEVIEVTNMRKFCAEQGLSPSKMCLVVQGKQSQHKGWKNGL